MQTLLGEKWRSFANRSLPSMLKLRSTVHEVVSQLLRPIRDAGNPSHMVALCCANQGQPELY